MAWTIERDEHGTPLRMHWSPIERPIEPRVEGVRWVEPSPFKLPEPKATPMNPKP